MASKWENNIWNLVLCKTGELDFLIDAFLIIAQKEYKILESNVSLRKKNLHCANRIFIVTRVNYHCANRIFKLFIRRNSLRKKNGQIWWSLRLLRIFVSLRKKNLSLIHFWQIFRESNGFLLKKLLWFDEIFFRWERISRFSLEKLL